MIEQQQIEQEGEEQDESMPGEQEAFETLVAGLREHIFGAGEEGIVAKLRQSQDIHDDIGSMALALIMEGAKQAAQAGVDADFDLLISVGAEVVDDLLEIAEAMGVIDEIGDDDREKALLAAIRAYLMSADVPPEEQEAAKQQLQMMQAEGVVDETAERLRGLGERSGVDPFADGEQVASAPQPMRMMEG